MALEISSFFLVGGGGEACRLIFSGVVTAFSIVEEQVESLS